MDIIIPKDSCHQHEPKMSSINYLNDRVHIYSITKEIKQKEYKTYYIMMNIIKT
jgi:hypothetical protein